MRLVLVYSDFTQAVQGIKYTHLKLLN